MKVYTQRMPELLPAHKKVFKKLNTPAKIQDFLDTLPANFEPDGDTHRSPIGVLEHKTAHCIEGAAFAAAVLWYHGHTPLLMDFTTKPHDEDHVIAPFVINGYWGAISKTNHNVLRYRDPVYKSYRELAMSYFHEYLVYETGEKTLISFSKPVNLTKIKSNWVTSTDHVWFFDELLDSAPHISCYPPEQKRFLRKADMLERGLKDYREWNKDGSKRNP